MTANAPESLDAPALIGGRYRSLRLLGKGGTGTVYEVHDERSGRRLALKILQPNGSGAGSVSAAMFEREYHALCQLAHPRIIEVFDYGIDAGCGFYTMELLDGIDLQSLGMQDWPRACALLCDVASSLAIVHSRRLVHRDVSARNVRCTSDGRAKLLDFGAMVPMGISRNVVGTPSYIAPEVMEMQALDGRADLFALGALAYFMLTGYHAYEARSLASLSDMWRIDPMLPSELTPGIPVPLERLVMELLQLDRNARPSSAAEVMERLSGIAGLPLLELPEVKRSYLIMPTLVGREPALEHVRTQLSATIASGRGGGLSVEGEAGVGRSRFLDACALEARLRGMLVLRGDAADSAERGDYGLLQSLCQQLWQAQPEVCERVAERRGPILHALLPSLISPAEPDEVVATEPQVPGSDVEPLAAAPPVKSRIPPHLPAVERQPLLRAVQELLLSAARAQPLLITVDDCEAIDEPSSALLGMLAKVLKQRPIVLITSSDSGAPHRPALSLLLEATTVIQLDPLDAPQCEALLRSIFGEVAHVAALASTIFAVALGNPRATMTLTEELIERDIAKYEAGRWSLPAAVQARDLPDSASAALMRRLRGLSADARELAEAFALAGPTMLPLDTLSILCTHGDRARTYRALEELLVAAVLERVGERCRFSQRALPDMLVRDIPQERKRGLHERIARVLDGGTFDVNVARHQLLGGMEREAIEGLRQLNAEASRIEPDTMRVLQLALEAADRIGLSFEIRLELRVFLLRAAAGLGRRDVFVAHAAELSAQCQRDSGLLDYHELPSEWPAHERAAEALRRAQARYQARPDRDRGLPPELAASCLARVHAACNIMSAVALEVDFVDRLPRLDPIFERHPRAQLIQVGTDIIRLLCGGRMTRAMQRIAELIHWLQSSTDTWLPPQVRADLRCKYLLLLASFAATSGHAHAGNMIAQIEQVPGYRNHGWRIRMVYELMHGNLGAAADCQRQAELFDVQDAVTSETGSTMRIELIAHMYAENLLGVKSAMEGIARLAAHFPGWKPTLAAARCHYRRLQGDALGGLAELQPALSTRAGTHLDWWLIAYSHIKVLCDLNQCEEAASQGQRYLRLFEDEQLSAIDFGLAQATAEALARVGRVEEARCMIDGYIRMHERFGTRGLRLGLAYETAARVAMAAGDEFAVARYTAMCAEEYKGGRDLLLKSKLERLLREAQEYEADQEAHAAH